MAQYINSEVITMWLLKQFIIPSTRVLNTYIMCTKSMPSYSSRRKHHFIPIIPKSIIFLFFGFIYFDRKLHQLNPMLVKYLNTMGTWLCDNII